MPSTYSFLDVKASLVGPGGSISLGSGSGNAEEGISVEPVARRAVGAPRQARICLFERPIIFACAT